jgi:hypothetical protein
MRPKIIGLTLGALCFIQTAHAAVWSQIPNSTYSWQNAYRYCTNLNTDGRSDWRLPTALELNSRFKNSFRPPWDPNGSMLDWLWTITRKDGGPFFKVNANNGSRSWHEYPAFVTCIADSTIDPNAWQEDASAAITIKDWSRVIRIISPQVKRQNSDALIIMAKMYFDGTGVPKNEVEAFRLYLAAAKQGDSVGELSVGQLYELGRGTAKDSRAALYWYEKAAAQNLPGSSESLAKLRGASAATIVTDSDGQKCSSERLLSATSIVPEKKAGEIKKSSPKRFSVTWENSRGIVKMIGSMTESDIAESNTKIGSTSCYEDPDEGSPDNPLGNKKK